MHNIGSDKALFIPGIVLLFGIILGVIGCTGPEGAEFRGAGPAGFSSLDDFNRPEVRIGTETLVESSRLA